MSNEKSIEFYQSLAQDYHLIANNWEKSVNFQGKLLSRLIEQNISGNYNSILDCTCGIGTQIIGLAKEQLFSHHFGSDISSLSIERAIDEALRQNVNIDFRVEDICQLGKNFEINFDVIVSFDNAIPHLLTEEKLLKSFIEIYQLLHSNGHLIFSIRDYDNIIKEKPVGTIPRTFPIENGKRIVFQTWEWHDLEPIYELSLYIIEEAHTIFNTKCFNATYRAWQRHEIEHFLTQTGFRKLKWLFPEQSGYYQPILLASK